MRPHDWESTQAHWPSWATTKEFGWRCARCGVETRTLAESPVSVQFADQYRPTPRTAPAWPREEDCDKALVEGVHDL